MLSGISQERNARSRGHWFAEFCNSRRLSHFAAHFIGVRAKISATEAAPVRGRRQRRQPLNPATPPWSRAEPVHPRALALQRVAPPAPTPGARASSDLRFSPGPSRTPSRDRSKIHLRSNSESPRHGGIFEAFLGSTRTPQMSTGRFEN